MVAMNPKVRNPFHRARARGAKRVAEMMSGSNMLAPEEIPADITPLITLEAFGMQRAPAWQFDAVWSHRPGLQEIVDLLGGGWAAMHFLCKKGGDGRANHERLTAVGASALISEARTEAEGGCD